MKFICKKCFNESEAEGFEAILQCEKICYECINKERKEKKRQNSIKQKLKEKIQHTTICENCDTPFNQKGTRKYCTTECKKKGIENKRLYSGLKKANVAIALSKIKVYGNASSQYMDNTRTKKI